MTEAVETADLKAWLTESAAMLTAHKERLCDLDSATGDAR